MIRVSNLPLPIGGDLDQLKTRAAQVLGLHPDQIADLALSRQSIDARKKSDVHYVCTADLTVSDEEEVVRRAQSGNVTLFTPRPYVFPTPTQGSRLKPVVVGMGPAGLFAALFLARAGVPSVILERGRAVETRTENVERFWATGELDPTSNVQFGEGGAGTFSDGKLTTLTHDARLSAVMDTFVEHGAPEDVRWSNKPHIGTDVLRDVVKRIREELLSLGCEVRFEHRLDGLSIHNGALKSITVASPSGPYELEADALILAPGHSARDTFEMLFDAGVPMASKPFAMGVRVEHLQSAVSEAQYGSAWDKLPPSDYKLACHLPNGRSAFTFCVCPGGEVVAAASEPGRLVINGMSRRARDGKNINGGLLVGLGPEDFPSQHPLAGVELQRSWEEAAFRLGGGGFRAPIQSVGAFLGKRAAANPVLSTYRPGVVDADLSACLPGFVTETLRGALPLMGRRLRGFDAPQAVLTGVETRSSSPVRILRGENLQSPVRGLFPCGEGAGYAGGIMSAAADGIRIAEAVATVSV
ncbi:MAG: hypothetical protein EOM52_03365 [Clostridia bacterium]|nr:hypothetical protein [Clostridia bacterium]